MTTKPADDFDAIRAIVEALKPFDSKDQERIIRWAREKIGLASADGVIGGQSAGVATAVTQGAPAAAGRSTRPKDIRTFIEEKAPQSENQLAATVAYYYRFEAPENEKKADIGAQELIDAAREAGRDRPKHLAQILVNTHRQGYFNKAGRGRYALNTVGENLVAMALPQGAAKPSRSASTIKRNLGAKKKKT